MCCCQEVEPYCSGLISTAVNRGPSAPYEGRLGFVLHTKGARLQLEHTEVAPVDQPLTRSHRLGAILLTLVEVGAVLVHLGRVLEVRDPDRSVVLGHWALPLAGLARFDMENTTQVERCVKNRRSRAVSVYV